MADTDDLEAGESLKRVFAKVEHFIGEKRQPNDDMTLVVVWADEPSS